MKLQVRSFEKEEAEAKADEGSEKKEEKNESA